MTEQSDKPSLPEGWLAVDALDIEAQGVARREDGKVVFKLPKAKETGELKLKVVYSGSDLVAKTKERLTIKVV